MSPRARLSKIAAVIALAAAVAPSGACGSNGSQSADTTTSTSAPVILDTTSTTAVPIEEGEKVYVYTPKPGDCWEKRRIGEEGRSSGQEIVLKLSCDKPHANETFAVVEYTERQYPGDQALRSFGKASCPEHFEAYVGRPYETSELEMGYYVPSQSAWNQTYRHFIACYVYRTDGTKLIGSVRGTGI
jgi:hypothetical protein